MLVSFEIATLINEREVTKINEWKEKEGKAFIRNRKNICSDILVIHSGKADKQYSYWLLVLECKAGNQKDKTENWYIDRVNTIVGVIEKILILEEADKRVFEWKIYQMRYKLGLNAPLEYAEVFKKGAHLEKEKMKYIEENGYIGYRNASATLSVYINDKEKKDTSVSLSYQTDRRADHQFQLELILKRDRIQWLIPKLGFMDRSPYGLLKLSYTKAIELFMYHIYLKRILGTGRFLSMDDAMNRICNSGLSGQKAETLCRVVTQTEELGGVEGYLRTVDNGTSDTTAKRNTAMGYLRKLNLLDVNPITCNIKGGMDNMVVMLPEVIKINVRDKQIFYRQFGFLKWYEKEIMDSRKGSERT